MTDSPPSEGADPRRRSVVRPSRIVFSRGEVTDAAALIDGTSGRCTLRSGAAVLLDFGRELNGGVRLDVAGTNPRPAAAVRLRFGESVSEAMGDPGTDHGIHDWTVSIPNMSSQEFGLTGFRFVRIDLVDESANLVLDGICAISLERPMPLLGRFECSDELLNRIWQVGARTVHLCCQNYILDGIKRDRLVWMGDVHPQVAVIHHAFGHSDIVPQTLDLLRDATPAGAWMNDIPSYTLWWILAHWDWYRYRGDIAYLRQQKDALKSLEARLLQHIGPDGYQRLPGRSFLDWASHGDPAGVAEGIQALTVMAFKRLSILMRDLNEPVTAENCERAAASMAQAPMRSTCSKQASALRVLAGLKEAAAVNREVFAVDPARGLSPWFASYVLEARAMAGDMTGCLQLLRHYWGGMLRLGATSFWEHFDIDWLSDGSRIDRLVLPGVRDVHAQRGEHCYEGLRHSLCHGWSGGPTAFLSHRVLGVHPVDPGYRKVKIHPQLGDLQWARGTIPTPHGPIEIEHRRGKDGTVETIQRLPEGVAVSEVGTDDKVTR